MSEAKKGVRGEVCADCGQKPERSHWILCHGCYRVSPLRQMHRSCSQEEDGFDPDEEEAFYYAYACDIGSR